MSNRAPPVRLATLTDAKVVVEVLAGGFAPLRELYTPGAFAATVTTPAEQESRIGEGPVWLAFLDGSPIGTVSAVMNGADCYIRGMAVLPAARRSGVARALLDAVSQFATEREAGRLTLHTTPFLDAAIALYRSEGFDLVTNDDKPDLHGTPLLAMAKDVRS